MSITYSDSRKDLPSGQLRRLFLEAGWSDGSETEEQKAQFNLPFLHSTLVVSAWEGGRLVGAARVLSDQIIRSILYDVIVEREYQGRGIGRELLRRCRAHFPRTEWLVQTTPDVAAFYEKLGFEVNRDVFLTIPFDNPVKSVKEGRTDGREI